MPHAHFEKYPSDFPMEELRIMYEYAADRESSGHDLREVGGCAWWVIGYGVGKLPDSHGPVAMSAAGDHLEAFKTAVEPFIVMKGAQQPVGVFPWAIVLPLAIELLKLFLNRKK